MHPKDFKYMISILDDPTPNRFINQRMVNGILIRLKDTDLALDETTFFHNTFFAYCKKLVGVWRHLDAYAKEEERLVLQASSVRQTSQSSLRQIDYSDELFLQFDGFLSQTKSSLDHVVKLPQAFVGKSRWTLRTFGKKGQVVSKALGNLPGPLKVLATQIDRELIQPSLPWLTAVIDARDDVTHRKTGEVDYKRFALFKDEQGHMHRPQWTGDQTIRDFMQTAWQKLFIFCEDFIMLFMSMRLLKQYVFCKRSMPFDSIESPWTRTVSPEMREILAKQNQSE